VRPEIVEEVVSSLKEAGVSFACYLPDGWLADIERRLHEEPRFTMVPVVNEGEGVAMCAGAWLGGKRSVMLMETSGLRMACEELARLGLNQGVPVFMLLPYRGDLGDAPTWAQHQGWTMEPILQALRAQYRIVRRFEEIRPAITGAVITQASGRTHVAVIFGMELCVERCVERSQG
jgi:sulfopyruvate decarboxylase subunit alpha